MEAKEYLTSDGEAEALQSVEREEEEKLDHIREELSRIIKDTNNKNRVDDARRLLGNVLPKKRQSLFVLFDKEGYTLLHNAISSIDVPITRLLIDYGVDLKLKTNEHDPISVQTLAALTNNDQMIHLIMTTLRAQNNLQAIPGDLALAIRKNLKAYAAWLISDIKENPHLWGDPLVMFKVIDKENPNNSFTALDEAVRDGEQDILASLMDIDIFKAQINGPGLKGETALHWACKLGSIRIYNYLVNECHAVENIASDGKTILHSAVEGGNGNLPFIKDFLWDRKFENAGFESDEVQTVLEYINMRDRDGNTALHYAYGQLELMAELKDKGALLIVTYEEDSNEDYVRALNNTVLHRACLDGNLALTRQLLEWYPEEAYQLLTCKSPDVDTPYYLALEAGRDNNPPENIGTIQKLLLSFIKDRGDDESREAFLKKDVINIRDPDSKTTYLDDAYDNVELLKDLKEQGAQLIADGDLTAITIFHRAGEDGDLELVEQLMEWYPEQSVQLLTTEAAGAVSPYYLALEAERKALEEETAPPINIVATEERLLKKFYECTDDMQQNRFRESFFDRAASQIANLRHSAPEVYETMSEMLTELKREYKNEIPVNDQIAFQKVITFNNKILYNANQLTHTAMACVRPKESPQRIANKFKASCNRKLVTERHKTLIVRVVSAIVFGVIFGVAAFLATWFTGPPSLPAAGAGTVTGATLGVLIGPAVAAAAAGAVVGQSIGRAMADMVRLQYAIYSVNRNLIKMTAQLVPQSPDDSIASEQSETEMEPLLVRVE